MKAMGVKSSLIATFGCGAVLIVVLFPFRIGKNLKVSAVDDVH